MAHNTDPFTGHNFMVALGGIGGEDEIAGGFQAWPVKWSGPHLNATSSHVAVESVELTHEGLEVHAASRSTSCSTPSPRNGDGETGGSRQR